MPFHGSKEPKIQYASSRTARRPTWMISLSRLNAPYSSILGRQSGRGHELHEAREYCWNHSHRWWDVETHGWRTDHDWTTTTGIHDKRTAGYDSLVTARAGMRDNPNAAYAARLNWEG
jgi:hypothetical protein